MIKRLVLLIACVTFTTPAFAWGVRDLAGDILQRLGDETLGYHYECERVDHDNNPATRKRTVCVKVYD